MSQNLYHHSRRRAAVKPTEGRAFRAKLAPYKPPGVSRGDAASHFVHRRATTDGIPSDQQKIRLATHFFAIRHSAPRRRGRKTFVAMPPPPPPAALRDLAVTKRCLSLLPPFCPEGFRHIFLRENDPDPERGQIGLGEKAVPAGTSAGSRSLLDQQPARRRRR